MTPWLRGHPSRVAKTSKAARAAAPVRLQAPALRGADENCTCPCTCGKKGDAGALFEDDAFPARWDSLVSPCDAAQWKRPRDICEEPKIFVDGTSRFDVQQGGLGTCWFLAACAAVADRPELLKKVIPEGQVLFGPGYDGSVRFRFWKLGQWEEVRIDDRLPVDSEGSLAYAHCGDDNEFWLPLLEKALARFHGKYEDVNGGMITDGLMTLTGFTVYTLSLRNWTFKDDFQFIRKAYLRGALIVCATDKPGPGVPDGHAYSVTKVFYKKKDEDTEELRLLRVRNPWGGDTEWTGAWKDGDERWNKLSQKLKDTLEYKPGADGEFWMEMKDFAEVFPDVAILKEKPDGCENTKIVAQVNGQWTTEYGVGGPSSDVGSFSKNPQFLLEVETDKNTLGSEEDEEVEGYVELMHDADESVSFCIFEAADAVKKKLSGMQLLVSRPVAQAEAYDSCGAGADVRLRTGARYVVVAASASPGTGGAFLLRVFAPAPARLTELKEHACCPCPHDDCENAV